MPLPIPSYLSPTSSLTLPSPPPPLLCRPSGRSFSTVRPTRIELGGIRTADASAICTVGPTTVLCTATLEVTTPLSTLPHQGFLAVDFHLTPLSTPPPAHPSPSPLFSLGRPTPLLSSLSHHLTSLLTSHTLALTSLALFPSTHCYTLHLDLTPLSHTSTSALYDTATIAALTALTSLRLPPTLLTEGGEVVIAGGGEGEGVGEGRGVGVRGWPVVTSFVLVGERWLVDVDGEEEEYGEAGVRVAVGEDGEVLDVWKVGGAGMDKAEVESCIQRAKQRSAEVIPLIKLAAQGKAAYTQ